MKDYLNYIKEAKKVEIIARSTDCTVRFFCNFIRSSDKSLFFTKPTNKYTEFNYPKGQTLELYIYTANGVFRLKCRLESCENQQCELLLPQSVDKIQRREFIRVGLKVKTIINLKTPTYTKNIKTDSKDLSANGIRVILDEDISKYDKNIELSILFPDNIIKTRAKLIKVKPTVINSTTYYETSLSFITSNKRDVDFIVKKCFEFQAQQRKKLLDKNFKGDNNV